MRTIIPSLRRNLVFQFLILAFLMPGLSLFPVSVQANPQGPNVRAGNVNINGLGTRRVNINQDSNRAVINWQSFSIQNGEVTNFNQPGRNSVALNRVVTGNPTAIYGQLKSNGGVILINPNGIVVHSGGTVDVGGLLTLSTLDTKDSDFMNGGSIRYRGNTGAGVTNYGAISSSGGDVVLLGNFLQNYGTVNAPDGNVAFGAGGDIIVDHTASGGMISVLAGSAGGGVGIDNSGEINGAAAELKAHGNVYALAIKNDGIVRASGYNFKGGKLTLSAGSRGSVVNTGQLIARSPSGAGGEVNIEGGRVSLSGGSIDASGEPGMNGGSVSVTGREVLISDTTAINASGAVGGSVTVSGGSLSSVGGSINVGGTAGSGGSVDVTASEVVVGSTARIDASGVTGGSVRIGGGFQGNATDIRNAETTTVESGSVILADGSGGSAGEVILWADGDTMFGGQISAQARGNVGSGGFVEVSGAQNLSFRGNVSTAAVSGQTGTLLLDPTDVSVGPNIGATITDDDLVRAVLQNNVVIHTASAGTSPGNITIQSGANIVYDSPNSLAFFAHGNITVNGDIKNHGTTDTLNTGNITLVAGWDGTNAAAFGFDPTNPGSGSTGPSVSAADVIGGAYGAWGTNNGSIYLNDAGSNEPVEVGSARGETNAFGYDVILRAGQGNEQFTQLGYRRENDLRGVALRNDGGTAAVFTGTPAGLGSAITITADAPGGGPINLIANANRTVNDLIADWNTANPTNTISLTSGDGSQTVTAYTPLTFDNTTNTAVDVDFMTGVQGNINAYGKRDVLLLPGSNVSAEEGFKANDRSYVMIGHGGQREQDNGHENRGGTDYGSDSGHISVGNGNNSGDITVVAGRSVTLVSNRAESFTQIGHGGLGHDDPDLAATVNFAPSHNFNPSAFYGGLGFTGAPGVGVESRRSIWGEMSGDITVTAGVLSMEAGFYNAAPTQIGHGGERVRGSHTGNINVTTTIGGINVEAAPDSAIGGPANTSDWRWRNNRDQSHAQIGHGGFDSDYTDNMQLPRRNGVILPTDGTADIAINNTSVAGDGIRINPFSGEAFGHQGNISVTSALGIEFRAGNGTDAFAMLGHGGRSTHGDHKGNVTVVAESGDIIFDRDADQVSERGRDITNRGQRAHVQIGHGGGRYQGGSTGDIDVRASGDIEFYAGRSESYAMIGHGGRGEDGSTWSSGRQRNNQANGTHSGTVTVIAGGNIDFRSGFSPRPYAFSQIGHGGYFQQADVLDPGGLTNGALIGGGALTADQQGHNGAIVVDAGGDISFKAGADSLREGQTYFEANGYDNWTMIGHGGRHSKGDHHGTIDVTAGGDVTFEARGGWDGVTVENDAGDNNTNTLGTPRLNSAEDNGRTGYRNFAMIGHGGYDATHNNNSADNWNNSGVEGDGLGIDYGNGESDITVSAGGNLTFLGAMEATAGPAIPLRMFEDNGAGNPTLLNIQNTYVSKDPLFAGAFELEVGGPGTGVVITANDFNDTGNTDDVVIVGNGTDDLTTLIANWNANVSGVEPTVTLAAGDGSQVLATGSVIYVTPYNFFTGTPAGASEAVVLRSTNISATAPITLTGDGTLTLTDLVSNWNNANPQNTLDLVIGNGGDVIAANETLVVQGGVGPRPTVGQQYSQHYGRLNQQVRANGEVWNFPDAVLSAEDSYAQIGHGGRSSDYRGGVDGNGHRGNITINAGGDITVQAGDIEPAVAVGQFVEVQVQNFQDVVGIGTLYGNGVHQIGPGTTGGLVNGRVTQDDQSQAIRNFAQIGHGGYASRGDHAGDITVTGDGNLKVIGGEGREDYGQIGHGGVEADGQNSDAARLGDLGNRGTITINVAGSAEVLGGGRDGNVVGARGDDPTALTGNDDMARGSYGQIGHGGFLNGGSHSGDISLTAGGDIDVIAGSSPRGAYGMVGNGGYWARAESFSGNISVISTGGDITVEGGKTIIDSETQTGGLDNTGQISSGRESFAQIGNGGFDADAQGGDQNNDVGSGGHTGDITVIAATGAVIVRGGGDATVTANDDNYRGLSAQIGNGGSFTDGDHTGNITVSAGKNVTVNGGGGAREAFGQIGHGGYDSDGEHVGVIDIDARGSVILNRGDGLFNPWSKVGHGGQAYGGRNNNGAGTRSGDIYISAGLHFNSTSALVGHVDSKNDGNLFAYEEGNTYIGVSRNNPFAGGAGNFITDADTVITSSGFGAGSELRLYMPDSSANMITSGTTLNNTEYSRTPAPGSTRNDETIAVEHTFAAGPNGEPVGDFAPVGPYPTNSFGLYNIYYAGDAPPVVPVDPIDPILPPVDPGFPFANFAFSETYDSFFRAFGLYDYDGYEGQLLSIGMEDAVEGENESASEQENRRRRLARDSKVGKSGVTFYVFEPGTNKYSSYYLFGYPLSDLSPAQ